MPFAILPDEKFAALVLRNTSTEYFAKKLELDLGNGLWVLNTSPMDVGNTWRQWIGSIRADEIAKANFWIIAKKASSTPSIQGQENENLKSDV